MSELEVRITFRRNGRKVGDADFLTDSFEGAGYEAANLIEEWAEQHPEASK